MQKITTETYSNEVTGFWRWKFLNARTQGIWFSQVFSEKLLGKGLWPTKTRRNLSKEKTGAEHWLAHSVERAGKEGGGQKEVGEDGPNIVRTSHTEV